MSCRYNFSVRTENALNNQVTQEQYACHVYQALSMHFANTNVALGNISKFFQEASDEERGHAKKVMDYIVMRGGTVKLDRIEAPPEISPNYTLLDGFLLSMELEQNVYQSLLDLHTIAEEEGDVQLADFVESALLEEQVESMKVLSDYIRNIQRLGGTGMGEFLFDKEFNS